MEANLNTYEHNKYYALVNKISYTEEVNPWNNKPVICFSGTIKEFFDQKKRKLFSQITEPDGFNIDLKLTRIQNIEVAIPTANPETVSIVCYRVRPETENRPQTLLST